MAKDTSLSLRNALIYSVYLRNHTPEGTFRALEADLDRIRNLGTDIIWLMPIHPIGVVGRKGSLGCPYANRDYRSVNPEYGTMDDFKHLVDEIHARGMKCIIDVVYNHTSPDSTLRSEHPEFFYHDSDGSFGNRFGDWADVIDLDYSVPELWTYQIESLKMWAAIVDGFRCDVASLVPVAFWKRARQECAKVKENLIWLAETVHTGFQHAARRQGMNISTDSEAYEAFDVEYAYDILEILDDYWAGKRPLHEYTDALNFQEVMYPLNYSKLRCLENHDQPRIASRISDPKALSNWTAFMFFQKGTLMLYGGQENCDAKLPSLFEKDDVDWSGRDIAPEIQRLAQIRKQYFPVDAWFTACADDDAHTVCARYENDACLLVGVFSLKGEAVSVSVDVPDGAYCDLISGENAEIQNATLHSNGQPMILKIR